MSKGNASRNKKIDKYQHPIFLQMPLPAQALGLMELCCPFFFRDTDLAAAFVQNKAQDFYSLTTKDYGSPVQHPSLLDEKSVQSEVFSVR